MNGFIVLDKESNVFSRTAGWRVAKMFGEKKFGHIGTLDPMATGVLVIAIGNATKMIPFVEENAPQTKEYLFGLRFGIETDSLDITGNTIATSDVIPSDKDIINACEKLQETTTQIPPQFSAIHINGVRAYELAHRGKSVEMQPRNVKLFELEYLGQQGDEYNFRVLCSKGTYVRAIVRDIAALCGAVATTTYIRRIKTNGFEIKNAVKLDFLENLVNNGVNASKYLLAPDCALGDIPVINLDDKDAAFYKNGGFIKTNEKGGFVRIYSDNEFVGIGYIENGLIHPKRTL